MGYMPVSPWRIHCPRLFSSSFTKSAEEPKFRVHLSLGTGRAAGLVGNRLVRAVFAEAQHLTAFSGFRDEYALAFVPLLWCGPWFLMLLGGLAFGGAGRFRLRRLASSGTGSGTLPVANLSDCALRLGLIGRVRRHRQLEFPLEGTAYYPLVGVVGLVMVARTPLRGLSVLYSKFAGKSGRRWQGFGRRSWSRQKVWGLRW